METKTKKCSKCQQEKPATHEFFSKNRSTSDELERWCKVCKAKAQRDHTARRRAESKPDPKLGHKVIRRANPVPTTPVMTASPAEIVVALRKGMAAEIVAMINEKYGL